MLTPPLTTYYDTLAALRVKLQMPTSSERAVISAARQQLASPAHTHSTIAALMDTYRKTIATLRAGMGTPAGSELAAARATRDRLLEPTALANDAANAQRDLEESKTGSSAADLALQIDSETESWDPLVVAFLTHLLRNHSALTQAALSRHLGSMVSADRLGSTLTQGSPALFTYDERMETWSLVPHRVVGEAMLLDPGSPKTSRRYKRGEVEYAVLPDGAEKLILNYLTGDRHATTAGLLMHLHRFGWTDVGTEQLVLHLAHFHDFELYEGEWRLAAATTTSTPPPIADDDMALPMPDVREAVAAVKSVLAATAQPLTIAQLLAVLQTGYPSLRWRESNLTVLLNMRGAGLVRVHDGRDERWSAYRRRAVPPQTATRPGLPCDAATTRQWRIRGETIHFTADDVLTESTIVRVHVRPAKCLLTIMLHKVKDAQPWWVASLICDTSQTAVTVQAAGWDLWRPETPPDWDFANRLLPASDVDRNLPCIATWRGETSLQAAWAIVGLVYHHFGVRDPGTVAIESYACTADEARDRSGRLAKHLSRRPAYDDAGRLRRPVLTHCWECGRPLSHPLSALLGIGPICRRRFHYPWAEMARAPGLPLSYWVGAQPLKSWQVGIIEVLACGRNQPTRWPPTRHPARA